MKRDSEEDRIDLDSSSTLELDRQIVVQETHQTPDDLEMNRRARDRESSTDQRELLQQPFHASEFKG